MPDSSSFPPSSPHYRTQVKRLVNGHAKFIDSSSDSYGRRFSVFCRRVKHAATHRGEWMSNERAIKKLDQLWNRILIMPTPVSRKRAGIEAYLDSVQEDLPVSHLGQGHGSFGHRMKLRRFQYQTGAGGKVTGFMNTFACEFNSVDKEYGRLVLDRFYHDQSPKKRKEMDKICQDAFTMARMAGAKVESSLSHLSQSVTERKSADLEARNSFTDDSLVLSDTMESDESRQYFTAQSDFSISVTDSDEYFTAEEFEEDDLDFYPEEGSLLENCQQGELELLKDIPHGDQTYFVPSKLNKMKRNHFKKDASSPIGRMISPRDNVDAAHIQQTATETQNLMQTDAGRLLQANTMVYGSDSIPNLNEEIARAREAAQEFGNLFSKRVLNYKAEGGLEALDGLIASNNACTEQNTVLISASGRDSKAIGGSWRNADKKGGYLERYRRTPMSALMDPKQNPYLKERLMSRVQDVHHHHVPYYGSVTMRGVPIFDDNDHRSRNFIEMAPVDLTGKTDEGSYYEDNKERIKEAACLKLRMALIAAMREGYSNLVLDLESFNNMGCSTEMMGDIILEVLLKNEAFQGYFSNIVFAGLEANPNDERETKLYRYIIDTFSL